MRRVLFDTGVYVGYLRRGELAPVLEGRPTQRIVHLSMVVAQELLVGAPDRRAERFLENLVRRFEELGRLEVPNSTDWIRAGKAIRKVGQHVGYEQVRKARLTNDALIAATALRLGATILTRNAGDFAVLHDYLPAMVVGL